MPLMPGDVPPSWHIGGVVVRPDERQWMDLAALFTRQEAQIAALEAKLDALTAALKAGAIGRWQA